MSFLRSRLRSVYPASTYDPSAVDNSTQGAGVGYLSNDGGTSPGTDGETIEIVFHYKSLSNAATARMYHVAGGRVNFSLTAANRVSLILINAAGTTLVNWTSSNNAAGILSSTIETEVRGYANLNAGVLSAGVLKRQTIAGIVGDWVTMPGAFTTGPVTGDIDVARTGQTGPEFCVLASSGTTAGNDRLDCEFVSCWMSTGALKSLDAFGAGGVRIDPALVTPFDFFVKGPEADLDTDLSANAKVMVLNGDFADVAAGGADPIVSAPALATNQVAFDGATDTDDFVPGAVVTDGTASATIIASALLSDEVGILYTGAITSGPFADNGTLTSGGSTATTNGASAAYAPTTGSLAAWAPGAYDGTVVGLSTTWWSNSAATDVGAAEFTLDGGRFPASVAELYVSVLETATVAGVPVSNRSAWIQVPAASIQALAPDQWFPGTPSAVDATTDRMDDLITLVDVDGLYWSTGTKEQMDSAVFPDRREPTTADGTASLVRLYYDGATNIAGLAIGVTISQATSGASGVLYRFASLTPETGVLVFESITGTFANNGALTATNFAALANGASGSVTAYIWATAPAIHGTPPKDFREFIDGVDDVRRTRLRATAVYGSTPAPYSLEKALPDAPPPTSAGLIARHVNRTEGMFLVGEFGGDARQIPRCYATTPANGDLCIMGVDITSPLYTLVGFGEFWNTPEMRGLGAQQSGMGMLIDAEDADRILFYGSNLNLATGSGNNFNAASGVYLSTDGGENCTQVLSLPDSPGSSRSPTRYQLHYLAYEPGTAATPTTRTAYCMHSSRPWTTNVLGNAQLYKSTNGGATWATDDSVRAASFFGVIHGIFTRDNGSGGHDLYVAGANGLMRRASGSSTWASVTGITAGKVTWVETRGTAVFAMLEGNGLWKSTNGTSFTRIFAYNGSQFTVSKVSPYNWIFCASRTAGVAARWSEDGGATWTHTSGGATVNNVIESIKAPGQVEVGDTFSHNLSGEGIFFMPHELDPTECLVGRHQHMGRIDFTKNAAGNITAIWSSRGFDYSRLNNVSWGDTYDEYALSATDRAFLYADRGPDFVHDCLIGGIKPALYAAIEGVAGTYPDYQAAGPIVFKNNGHKRVMMLIGEGAIAAPRLPVIATPSTSAVTKTAGSAGASTGSLTSLVMPKGSRGGTYELRCTTATANAGTFTLYAPATEPGELGAVIGTTNGSMGAQSIAWAGGNVTFSISDGASDYAAGANPTRFSWYYNPVGTAGIMSGATGTGYGTGWRGQRNPADPSKGCAGRGRYVMSTSAVVTRNKVLTYEFWGYSDGNVIWGLNGNSIMRSPDEGETWATFFAAPGGWSASEQSVPSITPSTHNTQRCYRVNDAGQVHRVDSGVATLVFDFVAVMALLEPGTTYVGRGTPRRPPGFTMTEDPHDPDLLHVSMGDGGGCSMLFRSEVGGGAASTWAAVPDAMLIRQEILRNPYTGEVLSFSRHGTTVPAMPTGYNTAHGINPASTIKGRIDRFVGATSNYVGV